MGNHTHNYICIFSIQQYMSSQNMLTAYTRSHPSSDHLLTDTINSNTKNYDFIAPWIFKYHAADSLSINATAAPTVVQSLTPSLAAHRDKRWTLRHGKKQVRVSALLLLRRLWQISSPSLRKCTWDPSAPCSSPRPPATSRHGCLPRCRCSPTRPQSSSTSHQRSEKRLHPPKPPAAKCGVHQTLQSGSKPHPLLLAAVMLRRVLCRRLSAAKCSSCWQRVAKRRADPALMCWVEVYH